VMDIEHDSPSEDTSPKPVSIDGRPFVVFVQAPAADESRTDSGRSSSA
jgi:hypothetical protein